MLLVMTTIRDQKGESFSQPWFTTTAAAAVRSFSDLVNDRERGGTIFSHSEDYALYQLGTFDDTTGQIIVHELPKHLVSGSSVKRDEPALERQHLSVV